MARTALEQPYECHIRHCNCGAHVAHHRQRSVGWIKRHDAALTSPQEALISNASPPPGHSPADTSVALILSAVVGFWCSLFTLVLVVTIVMLEATEVLWPGFLLGIGFITLLTGFVCSIVAMT